MDGETYGILENQTIIEKGGKVIRIQFGHSAKDAANDFYGGRALG